jgi:hypothetical protein
MMYNQTYKTMNRQDDRRYPHSDDYGRYEGYDRNDDHYHSKRNLTNEFEQHFQQDRGDHNYFPREHTYHEGNMGDIYERRQRVGHGQSYAGSRRNDWDNSDNRFSNQRYGRYSQDDRSRFEDLGRNSQRSYHYSPDNNSYRERDRQQNWENRHQDPRDVEFRSRGERNDHHRWSNSNRDRFNVNRYY